MSGTQPGDLVSSAKVQMKKRRKLMLSWLAAGVGAGLLSRAETRVAEAADGGNMIIGMTNNSSTRTRLIQNEFPGSPPAADDTEDAFQAYAQVASSAGVFGRNNATDGVGLWGEGPNGTGTFGASIGGSGVAGVSTSGSGVFGQATMAGAFGLRGDNTSGTGTGVRGTSNGALGSGRGVEGLSGSGFGVFGDAPVAGGIGIVGSGAAAGILGSTTNGVGLQGQAVGSGTGFGGFSINGNGGTFITQNGNAIAAIAQNNFAVGTVSSPALGLAVAGSMLLNFGNYNVANGLKLALVQTSRGWTSLYCTEGTVAVFEDYGKIRLSGGSAHVDIDPIFLETIEGQYHVYLTPMGQCGALYVTDVGSGGFTIREQGGSSTVDVCYRVMAQRKGIRAAHRLAVYEGQDPNSIHKVNDGLTRAVDVRSAVSAPAPRLPNSRAASGGGSRSSGGDTVPVLPRRRS